MADTDFSCDCGAIRGTVGAMPDQGLHLVCYCDSCRAGARYCGNDLAANAPLDLYLTPAQHIKVTSGRDHLAPFAFSPNGIIRWKTSCCGVQMFSTQPHPRNAFMSVVTARLAEPSTAGPVRTKTFVPVAGGKAKHEGKGGLLALVFRMLGARLSGKWRQTALFDAETGKPIAPLTLISREEKAALLAKTV